MPENQDVIQVRECNDYILYQKKKTSIEWFSFFLELKRPKFKRSRFDLGWNGERLANSEALNRLHMEDERAIKWALEVFKSDYPKFNSEIEKVANEMCIPYLVHFTNVKNLSSILSIGLHPRVNSEKYNFFPTVNDTLRLDGRLEATSLSIGFPNSRMFFKYRKQSEQDYWAVLVIDRSVLWKKTCAFCKYNAADARISSMTLDDLSSHRSLLGMFEDLPSPNSRREQGLYQYDPTDVQAEVLAFGIIPKSMIVGIVFDSPILMKKYEEFAGGIPLSWEMPGRGFFASRNFARSFE
ncbi:DarT ssDNA thymidine ADP-ribosyltransferase family protein [Zoogloea sp.]|uniref:DarT ssDNA thymidine ADP-ribosyltransferase family protein n=1 Tax=Zoogloea sp. TaxID=49181 RepID=UPI00263675D8|nr:DarT ssDNA thymidine ADP-ribosyltransferase family protein [Zoogloea sp.]MDD3353930.1 DarT ssDNA thymidine ADP-ribosyltransferase family protein [Zoogloea sp.]